MVKQRKQTILFASMCGNAADFRFCRDQISIDAINWVRAQSYRCVCVMLLRLLLLLCNRETFNLWWSVWHPLPLCRCPYSIGLKKRNMNVWRPFYLRVLNANSHNTMQQISFYSSFLASTTPCCVYFMCSCVCGVDRVESFLTATQFISSILEGETGYVRTACNRQGRMSSESSWSGKTYQIRNVSNTSSCIHDLVVVLLSQRTHLNVEVALVSAISDHGCTISHSDSVDRVNSISPIPINNYKKSTEKIHNYTFLFMSSRYADSGWYAVSSLTDNLAWQWHLALRREDCHYEMKEAYWNEWRQNECIRNAFDRLCQESFFGYHNKFTRNLYSWELQ